MKKVQAQGYNKEAALETTGLEVSLDQLKNATQAWKKAGSPLTDKQLSAFIAEYIKKQKLVGAYIVVDPSNDDTRLRPYAVINETTNGKRKTTTKYQIKEAGINVKYTKATKTVTDKDGVEKEVEFMTPYRTETVKVEVKNKETGEVETKTKEIEVPEVKVLSVGAVVATADKKDEAAKIMKELIEKNKTDYVVEIVKEVTEGQKYALYGQYTPSKSAKLGTFMFFVAE